MTQDVLTFALIAFMVVMLFRQTWLLIRDGLLLALRGKFLPTWQWHAHLWVTGLSVAAVAVFA